MKCKTELAGATLTIYFSGELDHCMADQIRTEIDNKILSSRARKVIFDLSELNFMDSTGIGLIIGRYKLIKSNNAELFIANPDENVSKILKLSGIFSIIPVLDNRGVYGR